MRVVESTISGPALANSWTRTTATCPNRFVVVGGGAQTEPPTIGGLKPIGSFPSDAAGNPVANGSSNPTSWTAVGLNGGQPAPGGVTRAVAVCIRARRITTQVISVMTPGPISASTAVTVTASCPATGASILLGGGALVTAAGAIPQSGVHLRGSYPSTASGAAVTNGPASAWTEVTQSGGMPAPGTDSTVFALCAIPQRPR